MTVWSTNWFLTFHSKSRSQNQKPEQAPPPPVIEEIVEVEDEEIIEEIDLGNLEVEELPVEEPVTDEIEVERSSRFRRS